MFRKILRKHDLSLVQVSPKTVSKGTEELNHYTVDPKVELWKGKSCKEYVYGEEITKFICAEFELTMSVNQERNDFICCLISSYLEAKMYLVFVKRDQ